MRDIALCAHNVYSANLKWLYKWTIFSMNIMRAENKYQPPAWQAVELTWESVILIVEFMTLHMTISLHPGVVNPPW